MHGVATLYNCCIVLFASSQYLSTHFQSSRFVLPIVGLRTWLICGFVVCGVLSAISICSVVCFQSLPQLASAQCLFQQKHTQTLSASTSFDPVSDSTPTAVVTEIDEDSAFTEAQDNPRVLLSQWKRHSVEMNASSSVGEEETLDARVPMLFVCPHRDEKGFKASSAVCVRHREAGDVINTSTVRRLSP